MANKKRRGGYGFSSVNLTGPGTVFTLGFIALAIGMGLLLSRGIAPKSMLSDPGQTGELEIVQETPSPDEKGLQLKTLKFRECGSTVTINMLLDKSSSMRELTPSGQSKMTRLKEAVMEMVSNARDESIIGIQSFTTGNITNDIPISYFKDIKSILPIKIAALIPLQATPTHDALKFSYEKLGETLKSDWYPKERKMNFIFISDGAPCPGIACPTIRTLGPDQDPRLYTPNPADQIKALGVNVYSLGIFSPKDRNLIFDMEDLLKSIASTPDNYYAANTGDDVQRLLKEISSKICNQTVSPTPIQ